MEVQLQTRKVDRRQLRGMRELAGLTQKEAAKRAGLTPAWLNKVEQGTRTAGTNALGALVQVLANKLDWPIEAVYLRVTVPVPEPDAA